MSDCLFCQLIAEKKVILVHEDEQVVAFPDIDPKAVAHFLIVPRQHIASVNEMSDDQENLLGHLFHVAKEIAADQGVAESGYRLIVNTGSHAGQTVPHIHMHLLAGEPLGAMNSKAEGH